MSTCFWRRQIFGYHPVIGWWHLPNLDARIPLGQTYHRVITNSVGMRSSRDYPKQKPAGRKRMIFLGDSYTAGDGVSNGQRFTDLLEQRHPNLDVLNFGLNGTGTDQQLLIYEQLACEYEVDAYVICICVENIARNMYTCFPSYNWREQQIAYRPKPYFQLQGEELVLHNQPVPREKRLREQLGDWEYAFPYIPGDDDQYAIYKEADSKHWRLMKHILNRFIEHVRGLSVFIVPMPMDIHYLGYNGPTYWPRMIEFSNPGNGVHVVDLLPGFTSLPLKKRKELHFPDDPHYTALAHGLVADTIEYEFLRHTPALLD